MSSLHTFKATGEMVILPKEEYETLLAHHESSADDIAFDEAVAEHEAGAEVFPEEFVEKLLVTHAPLREWRIYRGMSQVDLAGLAGIRQATISAIENGTTSPRIDTAKKIAVALNCDLDDLF